jgi:hypothetical protein
VAHVCSFHNATINSAVSDATRITEANAAMSEAMAATLPPRFNAESRASQM